MRMGEKSQNKTRMAPTYFKWRQNSYSGIVYKKYSVQQTGSVI